MKQKNFWKYNVIGSIIWSISILLLGVVFGEAYHEIVAYLPKLLILAFVLILLYFFLFRREDLQKYLDKKEKEFDSL